MSPGLLRLNTIRSYEINRSLKLPLWIPHISAACTTVYPINATNTMANVATHIIMLNSSWILALIAVIDRIDYLNTADKPLIHTGPD